MALRRQGKYMMALLKYKENYTLYKENKWRCNSCGTMKSLSEYYKDISCKSGYKEICKTCVSQKFKQYYLKNKMKMNIQMREWRKKNNIQWKNWFEQKYGKNPKCEVCGKLLSWKTKNRNKMVNLDHRGNKTKIIKSPSYWTWMHKCDVRNKQIFLSCNFGILCKACNRNLPTDNRKNWLKNVIKYTFGDNYADKEGNND